MIKDKKAKLFGKRDVVIGHKLIISFGNISNTMMGVVLECVVLKKITKECISVRIAKTILLIDS